MFGAVQILFELEDRYGLTPKLVDGEVHLAQRLLKENTTLDEEYGECKSLYPDHIDTDKQFGYAEDPDTEKRIEDLTAEILANNPEDDSDTKPSKRPRKTRL